MNQQPTNEREREVVRETREIRSDDGGGFGFLLGIILIIVLLILFFVYGLPGDQDVDETPNNNDAGVDVDLNLPDNGEGGEESTDTSDDTGVNTDN